jgi:hypothetical protein
LEILINNEIIDYSLDNEKNCLDVINGLSTWLETQGFFISELVLDGKDIFLQDKEVLSGYSIASVKKMSVIALNKQQMNLRDLNTLSDYFQLYEQAMKENNTKVMVDLGSQYDTIKESLPTLLMMNSYVFDSTLNELMAQSGILTGKPIISKKDELSREWDQIRTLIQGRIGEISTPESESIKTINTLKRLIPRLEEMGILFQSGKDKEALDLIIVLSELFSKSLRILSTLSERGTPLELPNGFIIQLNDILKELANAIETGDTILTGDLAEYEIIPKIEILEEIFTGIEKGETLC